MQNVSKYICCNMPYHQQNIVHTCTCARYHTHRHAHTQPNPSIHTLSPTVSHHQHIANYSQVLLILKPRVTGQPRVKWSVFVFCCFFFPLIFPPPKILILLQKNSLQVLFFCFCFFKTFFLFSSFSFYNGKHRICY